MIGAFATRSQARALRGVHYDPRPTPEDRTAAGSPGSAFDHVANVPKQCFQARTPLAPGLATSLASSQLLPSTTPGEVALAKGEVMSIDLGLLRGVPTRCSHAF
jgi:hypothetical protein